MARRKNAPESIRLKHSLSERLRELRTEFFGERGGPDMARTLGILVRTWYNYESGVTVPAEIILQVVELTSVEPVWLLRGEGPKFRPTTSAMTSGDGLQSSTVAGLLRAALDRLEQKEQERARRLSGRLHGRQQQRDQDRDDRDNHQQFDEREPATRHGIFPQLDL